MKETIKTSIAALILFLMALVGSAQTPVVGVPSTGLTQGWTQTGSGSSQTDTAPGKLAAGTAVSSGAPVVDIRHPSFAGGAVCDGLTDIGPALQAAANSIKAVGGQIQIVGSPLPCYWADPTTFDWSGRLAAVTIKITGQLSSGTTITFPAGINVIGQSGGLGTQFATGQIARINGPNITGTLGTDAVAGQAQTFTPSSMAGITTPTISTCTVSSITRAAGNPAAISATFTAPCNIPALSTLTLVGTSDPTLNATFTAVSASSGSTAGWYQGFPITGSTSTGGTLFVAKLDQGTAITIAGKTTCTIGSLSRTSRNVTAFMSGDCHIPAGYNVVIAGVSDSTYNGTFEVTDDDYILNALTWFQVGADSSSSGGTATGVNEDTIETTLVTATSGSNATAYFANAHASTDVFGIVPVMITGTGHVFTDLVSYGTGVAWWPWHAATMHFDGLSGGGGSTDTNIGMEINESFQMDCRHCAFLRTAGHASWSVRLTNQANTGSYGNATGSIVFKDSQLMGGFKMDNGGSSLTVDNTIVEQPTRGGIVQDSRNYFITTTNNNKWINNSMLQDYRIGFSNKCIFESLYGGTIAHEGTLEIAQDLRGAESCFVNDYFQGKPKVKAVDMYGMRYGKTKLTGPRGPYADNRTMDAEIRGSGASMAPSIVPHATLPVLQTPSSWPSASSAGSCLVTPGIVGPDGTTTAGQLLSGTSSVGTSTVYTYSGTPAVGDWIIYGTWINTPDAGFAGAAGGFQETQITIDNVGSTHFAFDSTSSSNWTSLIVGDWWHPVVAVAQVTLADGTAGSVRLGLQCNGSAAQPLDYWKPFMIYVPASEAVSTREIYRWRQQLLHGWVPSSATIGNLYALDPIVLPSDPTLSTQAATKAYVDAHSTLPPASATVLGGMKCDGSTTTCDLDGTVHASVSGAGFLTTGGGQSIAAANTLTGLPTGCQQYPCPVAKVPDGTTNVGTTGLTATLYTTPNDGVQHSYWACNNIAVTAVGTAGSFLLYVNATAFGVGIHGVSTGAVTLTSLHATSFVCNHFLADANTIIQYQVYNNGTTPTGTPTVQYSTSLFRLQ